MEQYEVYVVAISKNADDYEVNYIESFSGDNAVNQAEKFADGLIEGKLIRSQSIDESYDFDENEVVIEVLDDENGETLYIAGVMLKSDLY